MNDSENPTVPDPSEWWTTRRDIGWGKLYERHCERLSFIVYLSIDGKFWHLRCLAFDEGSRVEGKQFLLIERMYPTALEAMDHANKTLPYLLIALGKLD